MSSSALSLSQVCCGSRCTVCRGLTGAMSGMLFLAESHQHRTHTRGCDCCFGTMYSCVGCQDGTEKGYQVQRQCKRLRLHFDLVPLERADTGDGDNGFAGSDKESMLKI